MVWSDRFLGQIAVRAEQFALQPGKQLLLLRFHLCRLLLAAPLMIVAEQMQDAVQQQKNQFMFERDTGGGGIVGRPLRRNHHIPQQLGLNTAPLAFLHGKGDHIGRPVTLQIVPVELLNGGVINNQNRQFRLRTSRVA